MADDIVKQLQCIYNKNGCGRCTFCLAKAEIERLRAEVERLRAVLDAIDALHQQSATEPDLCCECDYQWPCDTARLLHPMTLDEAIDTLGTVHK